jgi:hypothetical protein
VIHGRPIIFLPAAAILLGAGGLPRWDEAYREGMEMVRAGELEAARGKLLLAVRLNPAEPEARRELAEVETELHSKALERARTELEAGRVRAARRSLEQAAKLRAGCAETERLLLRAGLRRHGEEWLDRDEITAREKAEELRAERRRRELELPERFVLHRLRGFRIWSDHKSDETPPFARRLLRLIEAQEAAYRELMAPLDPVSPAGGIDVVIFEKRQDYEAYSGEQGTAGIFLPARQASCFHLASSRPEALREEFLREVFLHEVTHQLDARVLGLSHPPRWLQEGLAMVFESARLEPDGRLGRLGERLPASLEPVLERCRPGREGWWGLERLCAETGAGLPPASDPRIHEFYVQSWLLVRLLIEGGAKERAVFFDFIDDLRNLEGPPAEPLDRLRQALRRAGATLEGLEERLATGGGQE